MNAPSLRNLADVETVVRTRIGFDPRLLGNDGVRRAVCQRMKELRTGDADAYVTRLLNIEAEFESLAELLVVPETWFFRDREPFHCLRQFVLTHGRSGDAQERLRMLSIPCSSGEEPYSIAMTLLDLGMLPTQFHIDAVDLSANALRRAAEGDYDQASFRGDEAAFAGLRERFFARQGSRFVAHDSLRSSLHLLQDNLISPSLLAGHGPYHVIFCRNVLIYLDAPARTAALTNLHRLLMPGGLLYVGHVEARIVESQAFQRYAKEFPFAFQPVVPPASSHPARPTDSPPQRGLASTPARARASRPATLPPARTAEPLEHLPAGGVGARAPCVDTACVLSARDPSTAQSDRADRLAAAQEAADKGHLDEAARICEEVLQSHPVDAQAILLLGLVSQHRGELGAAETLFQKVLYLEPSHKEALIHMMLSAQRRGDQKAAAGFRRRIEQAQLRENDR